MNIAFGKDEFGNIPLKICRIMCNPLKHRLVKDPLTGHTRLFIIMCKIVSYVSIELVQARLALMTSALANELLDYATRG